MTATSYVADISDILILWTFPDAAPFLWRKRETDFGCHNGSFASLATADSTKVDSIQLRSHCRMFEDDSHIMAWISGCTFPLGACFECDVVYRIRRSWKPRVQKCGTGRASWGELYHRTQLASVISNLKYKKDRRTYLLQRNGGTFHAFCIAPVVLESYFHDLSNMLESPLPFEYYNFEYYKVTDGRVILRGKY